MRKASEMIGLPVIVRKSGKKIETVKDVLFDKGFTKVIGFLVTEDGWFARARTLPWLGVLYPITKEAVFIESKRIIVDPEKNYLSYVEACSALKGNASQEQRWNFSW